jgi:hypothetical protein
MKSNFKKRAPALAVVFVLLCAGLALAQTASDRALLVNGKTIHGAIVEIQGKTYVDLRMLSDALGATLAYEPTRVTLALPTSPAAAAAAQATQQAAAPATGNLSTNFRSATIGALSEMREWQGAVESVIRFGVPVVTAWPQDYRNKASAALDLARVNVQTDADNDALQLLQNEFTNLSAWSDKVVAERKSLDASRFIDPNALTDDPALNKIRACSSFLGGMISSGVFADSDSCR